MRSVETITEHAAANKHQNNVKQFWDTSRAKKTLRPWNHLLAKPCVRTQFFSSRDAGSCVREIPARYAALAYSIPMVRWRCSSTRPQCLIIFSATAGRIKAKFYVEPPWVGGTKFCSQHLGHMTKMAATPIYGKNTSRIFFPGTGRPISTQLQPIIVCSNDDPGVDLDLFYGKVKFCKLGIFHR